MGWVKFVIEGELCDLSMYIQAEHSIQKAGLIIDHPEDEVERLLEKLDSHEYYLIKTTTSS
jgi:hypothetical protein